MAPLSPVILLLVVAVAVNAIFATPTHFHGVAQAAVDAASADLEQGEDGDDASADATRPVAILEHRQELQDDGTFNYAFSADNGLTQNEAFHPDGSRTGSYSYVDPRGESVVVKYRADRFGFHVLDGSSIPSTPPQAAPQAVPQALPAASKQRASSASLPLQGAPHRAAPTDYGSDRLFDPHAFDFEDATANLGVLGKKMMASRSPVTSASSGRPVKALSKQAGGKARSSAARQARHASYEDDDDDDMDVDAQASPSNNDVVGVALKQHDEADDGSWERHASRYNDGSYEPYERLYGNGEYDHQGLSQLYDDGSYERHARLYDDGSYEPYARLYASGGSGSSGSSSSRQGRNRNRV